MILELYLLSFNSAEEEARIVVVVVGLEVAFGEMKMRGLSEVEVNEEEERGVVVEER